MIRKTFLNLMLVLMLVPLMAFVMAGASGAVLAQDVVVQSESGIQATAGTAFTYQGRLLYNGTAINGTCSLNFKLYDAVSGGNQVGSTVTDGSVSVSDGYFSVELDFGSSAFTGEARWLEVAINSCLGGASNVTLSPRVALNPAPYALSLRPGTTVQGSDTSNGILGAVNTATSGSGAGLYGEARSSGGAGVAGWNIGNSGGYAVYGNNAAGTGTPYGVYGVASDSGSATSYGVYGQSNSSVGTGVGGSAPMNGVYGEATGTTGATYGVYGKSNSSSGYGVYSDGDAHVEGQLTWKPVTSYLSIPGSAFAPRFSSYQYHFFSTGSTLIPDDVISLYYLAPVQLPHGATVTEFTFFWTDSSNEDGYAVLFRIDLQGGEVEMARAETHGGSSGGGGGSTVTSSSSDTSIDFAVIDNSQYAYYVWLRLPMDSNGATVDAHGVIIRYTIDRPH